MAFTFPKIEKYGRSLACCLVGALIYGLTSCTDEINRALSGTGTLTFIVGGIAEGGAETLTRAQIEPQAVRQDLGDGLSLIYTLSIVPQTTTRANASDMDEGKKYRVIVYKASDNSYVTQKEFTVGESDNTITGLSNEPYKLVAISYNTTAVLADIGSTATTITVDPSNDLLHWVGSVDLTSGSPSSPISILFKHRFTELTVQADASLTGNPIIKLPATATLTPVYRGVLTLLSDATVAMATTGGASAQNFDLPTSPSTQPPASNTRFVFTGNTNPVKLQFNGDVVVDAPSGNRTLTSPKASFATVLLGGYSYTLNMRIEASKGDYYPYSDKVGHDYEAVIPIEAGYNATNSLTFLTYNLGADPELSPKEQMAYPHTDDKNIRVYGGFYQWGRKDVIHSLRDNYDDAQNFFTKTLYLSTNYNPSNDTKFVHDIQTANDDWVSDHYDNSNMWGNGGGPANQENFSYNSGMPYTVANQNDPCPNGYRVPTQLEWSLIVGGESFIDSKPYENPNKIYWVPVSDGKMVVNWSLGKMNGFALYASSVWNVADAGYKDGTKSLTEEAAPIPLMFLPAAGSRLSGTNAELQNVGYYGYYWSSTVGDTNIVDDRGQSHAVFFGYDVGFQPKRVLFRTTECNTRTIGESVRCVKAN